MQQVQSPDLRTLRIFVTIVRSGGFAAAQPVLGLGASSISEYMSRLETRLGVRLCERGRGGFRLTRDGKAVFDLAQRLLSSVEEFRLNVSTLTQTLHGELRVGLIDNTLTDPSSPLPSAIRRFIQRSHELRVHIEINPPRVLVQDVLNGHLHLAVTPCYQRIKGLDYCRLMDEEHGLYCGRGHPLFDRPEITAKDIQHSRVVSRGYVRGGDLKLIKAKTATVLADSAEARLMLLLTGEYIGFLPCHFASRCV